ncbi:hypothetical protein [Pseudoduganella sp. R-43]|uniref:hypothetical protein n=1 Tax=unclassified Pseudoduganella TaxID=2637179 RepID=UPI003CF6C2BA
MKNLRIALSAVFCICLSLTSNSANASEYVAGRKVVGVGCHNTDGICFVTLDGSAFGATLGCANGASNEFRFDNGDTSIGKRAYASFLAAALAGKTISVSVEGCTVQGYSKLAYFFVSN